MEIELHRVCRPCGLKMGHKIPDPKGEILEHCDNCDDKAFTLPAHQYGLNGHIVRKEE